ncbi:MAG: restriction endonuclease subunit S [Phormidesmis sp. CAN_BIN44]|nr:restriction endonuclease subunit S [Phormidesmis sp. CAN_BIN44]
MIQRSPLGLLPDRWSLVQLKDIATKIGSGATPRGGSSVYLASRTNYALIRSQHVFDRHFDREGLVFITDEQATELQKVAVQPRDVLLNITGDGITFGRACIAPKDVLPACVNQHVSIIRADLKVCLPEYLLCYLTHPAIKGYIESFNAGGSRRAITKGNIESFKVPLPPLGEQKAIAHILGTLDDKIELNQQINHTLEAIARALFKSWFIDFDPVRAKLDGRQPVGMDAETTALFPDEFEDSALGKIPKGWTVKKLKDVLEVSRSGLKPEEFREESFDYFSLPAFDEGKLPKVEEGNQIKSNKYIVHNNAVLLSKLNPHIPRVWLPSTSLTRRAVCSTEFLVILPLQGMTREYLYSLCNSQGFLETFSTMVTGTSGSHQRVKPEYLLNMDIVVSSPEITSQFTEIVGSLYRKVHENLSESQIFSSIRNALLPKLLSGEIRVQDAEKVVEAVV